ncbi:DUF6684 family protein [Halobaculum sp. MBLA0143]|uniref:DUF6684 family protein n=1 Tax=Halobaculum sp. MBLA0143 TaxID=3079933 RepID=UPI0035261C2C
MAATFDRDTLLDLLVNVIPLVIIGFFVLAFAVFDPFGGDQLGRAIQVLLLVAPFVALAVLTYISGKAIAGDEERAEVYHQGQATLDDAEPRHADEEPALEDDTTGGDAASADGSVADDPADDVSEEEQSTDERSA